LIVKDSPQIASIVDYEIGVACETRQGAFFVSAFKVKYGTQTSEFATLHVGEVSEDEALGIPVRIHSGCITGEVFGDLRCDCAWQFKHAIQLISTASKGVVVYLPQHEGRGNGLLQKVRSFRLMNSGLSSAQAFVTMGIPLEVREYAPAMEALRRLGVQRLRLITNNPAKLDAARQYGFEVVGRIPSIVETTDPKLLEYLESKKTQLGHLIEVPR
jgi:3,4-dihydroxy 2-butanone 4-phosphate synthase / GTP cyclohydrolase II